MDHFFSEIDTDLFHLSDVVQQARRIAHHRKQQPVDNKQLRVQKRL
jgi:hypothetical protein